LNYYEGNTLGMDIEKEFGLKGFDLVVGNPPYQNLQNNISKRGGGDLLWNKFVKKSFDLWLIENGFLLFVHPSGWRKPESKKSKFKGLFKLITHENQMIYLSIHNTKDGMKTFKCGTRYDWYLVNKTKKCKNTFISDENNLIHNIDLKNWSFLPNYNFEVVEKLIQENDDSKVIFSNSSYETRKPWVSQGENVIFNRSSYSSDDKNVSKKHTDEFKYPLIHSTPKKGVRIMYSSINTKGHFGVPKVIFGETGIYNAIIDEKGEYGMTQHAMAIPFDNIEEATNIKKAIESKEFKKLLDSCSWSNYMIDWRLFTYFKKDFWREFIKCKNIT